MESNVQKMRNAFANIRETVRRISRNKIDSDSAMFSVEGVCDAMLDLPLRNCDVGYVEDQIQRWTRYCKLNDRYYPPIHGFEWMQMPYKEGGAE